MKKSLCVLPVLLMGCATTGSYVRSDDTTLGRVVVYRNGIAYFERTADVDDDVLQLTVPVDKIDDFLKSLTVTDARTGERAPVDFPNTAGGSGTTQMRIHLLGKPPHRLKLTYVTETPAWKPSYRVVVGKNGEVDLQAWAIVDNTSGEDWKDVKLGVGSSSALSFRFDLRSLRPVQRETLPSNDLMTQAPPLGGASYGGERVVSELSDKAIAPDVPASGIERDVMLSSQISKHEESSTGKRSSGPRPKKPRGDVPVAETSGLPSGLVGGTISRGDEPADYRALARSLHDSNRKVVVEGFADKSDGDKLGASLERANRVRTQLIVNGVDPDLIVARAQGEQPGRAGGVRILESQRAAPIEPDANGGAPATPAAAGDASGAARAPDAARDSMSLEPIGTSFFESQRPMTVARGTSAMVSILSAKTAGDVIYLYDRESPRGNGAFAFKALRIKNPTDSVLESGPVTVYGEGRFIGEGISEPIPAHSTAFVPFALDRQILVERADSGGDKISRILSLQRGVFSAEVEHSRHFSYAIHNRASEPATVYVRHTLADGYKLRTNVSDPERIGGAHLFRVQVPPNGLADLSIDEATPVTKSIDLRSPADMDQVRLYLSSGALAGPLKTAIQDLIKTQQEIGNVEQHLMTLREQMQAYRTRMEEIHTQIVSLRLVKTSESLVRNLERKLQETSDKLSQATNELAKLEEKSMLLKTHFQDGVADLSLDKAGG